jgi:hypothetical protein
MENTTPQGTTDTTLHMADTPHKFRQAMRTGRVGDHIIYHTGLLLADRRLPAVGALAREVWKAYKDKQVCLIQRRLSDPFGCEYVAVIR